MSCAPYFIEDAEQDQHQAAPDENDFLNPIVASDGHIVVHIWIPVEKLMSFVIDEESSTCEHYYCDGERDAQSRNGRGLYFPDQSDCLHCVFAR